MTVAALACSEATAPVACNPSLVGLWATADTLGVIGLRTNALHDVSIRFARQTDVAAARCERFTGLLYGTGLDGRLYGSPITDSVVPAPAATPPPELRFSVYVQVVGSQRGEGSYAAVFSGAFADSVTFGGVFDAGNGQVSRPLRFRRVGSS